MPLARLALALAACLALALPAAAQRIALSDPFDVGRLGFEERRTLQAAMALEGTYDALIDGAWGAGSRLALTRATGRGDPRWADVRELVRRYDAAHDRDGWRGVWHGDTEVWHLRPDALLRREDGPTETRFVSPGGGLVILSRRDAGRPDALADAFAQDARAGAPPYRLTRDDRLVFAAQMTGGRHVYVRSDRARGGWETHVVLADEANRGRLQLVASSFARARGASLDPSDHPVLGALLAGDLPRRPEPQPERDLGDTLASALEEILRRELLGDAERDWEAEAARGARERREAERRARASGARVAIGFYVNTTDIVAPKSVVDVCGTVRIAGGPVLRELHRRGDLSLLAAPGRSDAWLPVAPRSELERGEVAMLAMRGRSDRVVAVAGAFEGAREGRRELRVESPLDGPAQDGAPVIDRTGRVIGAWLRPGRTVGPRVLAQLLEGADAPVSHRTDLIRPRGDAFPDRAVRSVLRLRCAGD